MINLTKLSPAPWRVGTDEERTPHGDHDECTLIFGPEGDHPSDKHIVFLGWYDGPQLGCRLADAEFIALARNVFDILMRREWDVRRDTDGLWFVPQCSVDGRAPKESDPFSTVIASELWYVANVEAKPPVPA